MKAFIRVVSHNGYEATEDASGSLHVGLGASSSHYTQYYVGDSPSFFPDYLEEVTAFLEQSVTA